MHIKQLFHTLLTLTLVFYVVSPAVLAEETPQQSIYITEVQTAGAGTGTSTQEFIELYNPNDVDVDITGWKIVYTNSSGNQSTLYTFNDYMFAAKSFIVGKLSSSALTFMPEITADFTYSAGSSGLAATSGGIQLQDTQERLIDSITWTSASTGSSIDVVTGLIGGMSAQRKCDDTGEFLSFSEAVSNYSIATPTPKVTTVCATSSEVADPEDDSEPVVDEEVEIPIVEPTTPDPDVSVQLTVLLNELFIDPASPQTDANDEFVEIYNPNPVEADISGYKIEAGITNKYSYIFPQGSTITPRGYRVVTSGDSSLTLSNTAGLVTIYNRNGDVLDSVTYSKAEQGQSWAVNVVGAWEWTVTPTKNATNVITKAPIIASKSTTKSKKTTSSSKKKTNTTVAPPIQLNEVYPDPASPLKDSEDEYIELYNPYPYAILIADYTIKVGETKVYSYTFPQDYTIPALGYIVVTSADTPLSLNNQKSRIVLLNNFDKEIDATSYTDAEVGEAWARDDRGVWVWTTLPTKQSKNDIVLAAEGARASAKTVVAGATVIGTDDTPLTPTPQPLPVWLLALIGVGGVCYAAYEYRFEIRNKIYKRRANRAAR